MTVVYVVRGFSGRHYIGMTDDLDRRLIEHRSGHTYTTRRLGGDLILMAQRAFASRQESAQVERQLKSWQNPAEAAAYFDLPG